MDAQEIKKLTQQIDALLHERQDPQLRKLLSRLSPFAVAQVMESLSRGRRKTFALLPPEVQSDVVLQLSSYSKRSIIPRLPAPVVARLLHFMNDDDATDLLQFFPAEKRLKVMEQVRDPKRRNIEKLLRFDPESAGGLMDTNFLVADATWTLEEVEDQIRIYMQHEKHAPTVVVREGKNIVGYVRYRSFLSGQPKQKVAEVILSLPFVHVYEPQDSILRMLSNKKADIFGVIDEHGDVLGVIHLHDLMRVMRAEATEDVYRFAGVSVEENVLDATRTTVQRRSRWLVLNLATAFLASSVVGAFHDQIAELAILAVYMPIVAGLGGNAATQTLAVVTRGLATSDFTWPQARRIIRKQVLAGASNGLIIGLVASLVPVVLRQGPHPELLGLALGSAMVINMFIAGLFGSLVPFILRAMRIDPAVASSIFVTMTTDVSGFLTFLSIGSFLLLR